MASAIADLLTILDLEPLEVNLFRGRSPQVGWQRVFGGQVIGQALVAACRTLDVASRPPHSMHAYFLLAGDPKVFVHNRLEIVVERGNPKGIHGLADLAGAVNITQPRRDFAI